MKTCWEIKQEIAAMPGNGKPNGWRLNCADCAIPSSGQSCWERCGGTPCCCAPLHITCDFCEVYLAHRREIAVLRSGSPTESEETTIPRQTHYQGGKPVMEKIQFSVPNLWADHHTLRVRDVLTGLEGVADVIASSAFRMVAVAYDPAVVKPETIEAALAMAGYPVAETGKDVVTQPVPVADGRKDPAWDKLGFRVARSDPRDVKK